MNNSSDLVVIKKYNNTAEACIDQGLLENEGVQSFVNNENSMFPAIDMITLSVPKNEVQHALGIVPGSKIEK